MSSRTRALRLLSPSAPALPRARPRLGAPHAPALALACVLALALAGCPSAEEEAPHSAPVEPSPPRKAPSAPSAAPPSPASAPAAGEAPTQAAAAPPHPGPWLWVKRASAGIYAQPAPSATKLGYVKRGGRVPVTAELIPGPDCPKGWLRVASGGFICSHVGTEDPSDPGARFAPRQADLSQVLPYPYARNAHNGTPLYKSLPTREQMYEYEPYLPEAKQAQAAKQEERKKDEEQMRQAGLGVGGAPPGSTASRAEPAAKDAKDAPAEQEVPLWEREDALHEVTLDELRKEADDVLAQRMMKGFYVAIDKTFSWRGRSWHKTTKGLVAPADRFWQQGASDFHGIELDGEKWQLPVGFVFGQNKTVPTYELDLEKKTATAKGSVARFEPLQLRYEYVELAKVEYYQLASGEWVRDRHIRVTTPAPRPADIGPSERWIDVDVSEQTLVVFEGDRPLYATLISTGKESRDKAKDHSTPRGRWRIREKHIASTMDGDGTAAGDLPYSIEDVPYVMFFHKAYATHGAFWHANYGVQMSHGCVNLAPLDAKWLFLNSAPALPDGYHGVWSTDAQPGSWVVVHD